MDLVEFTAEEMKGCPSFEFGDVGSILTRFRYVIEGDIVIKWFDPQTKASGEMYLDKLKCDPLDRMHTICKHLFKLMPELYQIQRVRGINMKNANISFAEFDQKEGIEISINPFLHTDRTSITREELGL